MISYSTFEREYMDALENCYVHDYSDDAIDMVLTLRENYPEYYAAFRVERGLNDE